MVLEFSHNAVAGAGWIGTGAGHGDGADRRQDIGNEFVAVGEGGHANR